MTTEPIDLVLADSILARGCYHGVVVCQSKKEAAHRLANLTSHKQVVLQIVMENGHHGLDSSSDIWSSVLWC